MAQPIPQKTPITGVLARLFETLGAQVRLRLRRFDRPKGSLRSVLLRNNRNAAAALEHRVTNQIEPRDSLQMTGGAQHVFFIDPNFVHPVLQRYPVFDDDQRHVIEQFVEFLERRFSKESPMSSVTSVMITMKALVSEKS